MRLEVTLAVLQAHRVSFNETAQRHGMAVTEAQVSALHARLCVDSFQGLAMHRDACVAKLPRADAPSRPAYCGVIRSCGGRPVCAGGWATDRRCGQWDAEADDGCLRDATAARCVARRHKAAGARPQRGGGFESHGAPRTAPRRRCAPCRVRRAADGPVVVCTPQAHPPLGAQHLSLTHSYLPRRRLGRERAGHAGASACRRYHRRRECEEAAAAGGPVVGSEPGRRRGRVGPAAARRGACVVAERGAHPSHPPAGRDPHLRLAVGGRARGERCCDLPAARAPPRGPLWRGGGGGG